MAFGKQPPDWLELIERLTYVAAIKKIFLIERDFGRRRALNENGL